MQSTSQKSTTFFAKDLTVELTKAPQPLPKGKLGFGSLSTDHMLEIYYDPTAGWSAPHIVPFHYLTLSPMNSTFHYAQEAFEGMRAYRDPKDRIRLFRPELNAIRLRKTSETMGFPLFDPEELVKCIETLVRVDARWVPDPPASVYIRPTVISMTNWLHIAAPEQSLLFVILSPSSPIFTPGSSPFKALIETRGARAWPGGTGDIKIGANYAVASKYCKEGTQKGYQEIIWLNGNLITEASGCNFFVLLVNKKGQKELVTAELDGTILPGVTRASVLALAKEDGGFLTSERPLPVEELLEAHKEGRLLEMFVTGTAVVLGPVETLTYKDTVMKAAGGEVALGLRKRLEDIQFGRVDHPFSRIVPTT